MKYIAFPLTGAPWSVSKRNLISERVYNSKEFSPETLSCLFFPPHSVQPTFSQPATKTGPEIAKGICCLLCSSDLLNHGRFLYNLALNWMFQPRELLWAYPSCECACPKCSNRARGDECTLWNQFVTIALHTGPLSRSADNWSCSQLFKHAARIFASISE